MAFYFFKRGLIVKYEAFFSYATEDSSIADSIVEFCSNYGFNIWYAPISLEPGTKLLQSIDDGLKQSAIGILLLSQNFLNKNWPKYEFDILMRQNIENGKIILPIWLNINKKDLEELSPGLSGIVGIITSSADQVLFSKILGVLSKKAPTIGIIPIYQNPKYLFLSGRGEILIGNPDGPAASLWELILHLDHKQYPIYLDGELFYRKDILLRAADSIMHISEIVDNFVGKEGRNKIINILNEEKYYISE